MSNYPKTTIDPSEAALSAVQEALQNRDGEEKTERWAERTGDPPASAMEHRRHTDPPPPVFEDLSDPDPLGRADLGGAGARPANDDRQSIGQILHALQRQPARASFVVAAAFSAVWVIGCLALSWAYLADLHAALAPGHSPAAVMIGLGAAALLPIIFFFGVAHLAWRGQELRLIAQSMAGVAMRLAEPESVARDSIVSVGQAIRREVAAMGDGVERALARASELETLVQNEVTALARTYSDNEIRIRGLIQDLTNQRDALVSQAEQVRSAINNVHIDLTQDLSTISELVGQQVNEAAEHITHSLAEKGEHITLALGGIGDNMIQQLSVRGGDLLERLEAASAETSRAIAAASDRLTASLTFKTDNISEEYAEIAQGLEDMMTSRLDRVTDGFSEKALAVVDMMASRSQELSESIMETSSRVAETIAIGTEEVNSTLKTSGESLILDLNLRGGEVASKLEQAGSRVTDSLVSRSFNLTDLVRESAEHLVSVITSRSDAMKEMLATRLTAYEEIFARSGVELSEKMSRDAATLGNLITRHLSEFDRTVKTYGSELVERLGARTQDVSESMRSYIDGFDNRVTTRSSEVTTSLDLRLARFQETLDSRTQTLTEALSARVMDVAKTLADGGKEVISAIDQRVSVAATLIDSRGQAVADSVSQRIAAIDTTLGTGALQVANALDARIGELEQLLVGRAETVIREMDMRSRAAADLFNSRVGELSDSLRSGSASAEQTLNRLLATTSDSLGKSVTATAAVAEALNRSAAEAAVSLTESAATLSNTINKSATSASETIGKTAANATDLLAKSARVSADAIGRSASEAERTLVGMSADVAHNIVDKVDDFHAAVSQRMNEMTRVLDDRSNAVLAALTDKGGQFAGEVIRVTDQAVKAIESKGFVFTQTMMDNSEEIAHLINEASQNATTAVTRTLGQFQEGTQGVVDAAKSSITRTLQDLHTTTSAAVEESKETAAATVADMLKTHGMLRSDSTALFERLREANILLQEVLSGAHENMNAIEHTMVSRVSEFVAAMNDLSSKNGIATAKVEEHLGTFNNTTVKVLRDLGDLAAQFSTQGRSLAEAVEILEKSNRRTDHSLVSQQANLEALVATLDVRTDEFEQRLRRFSGLLEESLDSATARAREIAGIVADSSNESVHSIEQLFEMVRTNTDEQRKRAGETIAAAYEGTAGEVNATFTRTAERFAETMQGMKQMAAEMQRELEATRAELRRGVLELPQETADNAAQMRRVIVEQIDALAELNRIVARHGRALDAVEPTRRDAEPAYAAGGGRPQPRPVRTDIGGAPARPTRDITGAPKHRPEAPSLSPIPGGKSGGNGRAGGWLGDLLTRASREANAPIAAPPASRGEERAPPGAAGSLDSLSVDIGRMIDHEAAAELWKRYQRGERGMATHRLYTAQGQKTFDEIRNKYRADPEFRETAEHYIHEFERLLEEVSRGSRGPAVTRNYLTSDTGKVYTMLAHAAGRLDE